jgi:F0F1-type ATP synthase beta subunit
LAWYLTDHVKGRQKDNFNEFTYKITRQYRKLEEIINEVEMDEMPIESYTLIRKGIQINNGSKI